MKVIVFIVEVVVHRVIALKVSESYWNVSR